jgi:hypothetical protein
MQTNSQNISPLEKIISILTYFTMGIVGLVWLIISYFTKQKPKYFLMYNIVQSMIIAIILTILKLLIDIVFSVLSLIPFINLFIAKLNLLLSLKILTITTFIGVLSFSIVELMLTILFFYIIIGIIVGRIFYIPYLSDFIQKSMKSYSN